MPTPNQDQVNKILKVRYKPRVWISLPNSRGLELVRYRKTIVVRYWTKGYKRWFLSSETYPIPIYFAKFLLRKDLLQKLKIVGGEK